MDFSQPVATVAYGGHTVTGERTSLAIAPSTPAGALRVAVAARAWEKLGPATTVRYFPAAKRPVALVTPAPGGRLNPGDQLRVTLSELVSRALGKDRPKLSPDVPGHWRRTNAHTLVFTPSGFGAPLGSHVRLLGFAHAVIARPDASAASVNTAPNASPKRRRSRRRSTCA